MSAQEGIETINSFIRIGETIEKLPRLTLPQYQQAALELAKICYKLSKALEIAVSWFTCFSTFQFIRDPSVAKSEFSQLAGKYKVLRSGNTFKKLDFACGDIYSIYHGQLQNSLDMIFADRSGSEREDVQGIFENLSKSDDNMVAFVSEQIVRRLDSFVDDTEKILSDSTYIEVERIKSAENKKLQFTRDSRDILKVLVQMNDSLNDLVIKFARKTGTGISNIFEPSDFNKQINDVC